MFGAPITSVSVDSTGFKSITKSVFSLTIVGRYDEAKVRETLRGRQGVGYAGVN